MKNLSWDSFVEHNNLALKSVHIWSIFGRYFPSYGIFPHTEYPNVFSPNSEKYRPEKLRIRTLLTQLFLITINRSSMILEMDSTSHRCNLFSIIYCPLILYVNLLLISDTDFTIETSFANQNWFTKYEGPLTEPYSKPCQTSNIERLEKIFNGQKALNISAKRPILDICQGSEASVPVSLNQKSKLKRYLKLLITRMSQNFWTNET